MTCSKEVQWRKTHASQDTLGFDSPDFFWLIRVIDAYFYGRIKVPALWIWIFKTLHDTGNLHLLDRCKIFVLDGDGLEQLDDYTLHVANLVHDSEAFKELWSDVGLPVGHVEWEVFDAAQGPSYQSQGDGTQRGQSQSLERRQPICAHGRVVTRRQTNPSRKPARARRQQQQHRPNSIFHNHNPD
jgi:hypothetical protein